MKKMPISKNKKFLLFSPRMHFLYVCVSVCLIISWLLFLSDEVPNVGQLSAWLIGFEYFASV